MYIDMNISKSVKKAAELTRYKIHTNIILLYINKCRFT